MTEARLGVARVGGFRLGDYRPFVLLTVDGVARRLRIQDLSIRDTQGGNPNTATVQVSGFTPNEGESIRIGLGALDGNHDIFAGHILKKIRIFDAENVNNPAAYDLSCISHEWRLNRRRVNARFVGQSATAIYIALIAAYAPEVTTTHVAAGLPVLDEITFTNEDLGDAFDRIAARIGGAWYEDEVPDLHAFLSETLTATTIDDTHRGASRVRWDRDLSPVRTRVTVEGGGSTALSAIVAGETILPVAEPSWYEATGGTVTSGPQRITYTGVTTGGTGGLVGPGAAPSAAPALALAAGSGVDSGVHRYETTFTTAAGESIAGPTASITVGTVSPPASAPTLALSSGGSVDAGNHDYEVTFVTATGETTPSPVSNSVTTGGAVASPPGSAPTAGTPTVGGSVTSGAHYYATTYVTASGETAAGPNSGSVTTGSPASYVTPPSAPSLNAGVAPTFQTFWVIGTTVSAKVTYVNAAGETTPSGSSGTVTIQDNGSGQARAVRVTLTASSDPTVTGIHVYYTHSGANSGRDTGGPFANTSTTIDVPGGLTAVSPPGSNTAVSTTANTVPLTSIPTGPAGTTGRKVYRTAAGGAQLKLLTTINNNTTTTFSDTIADGSLGANVPTGATLNTVNLANIPIGAPAVTSRKLYRRFNGSGTFKLVTTIADNTTTTYADTTANSGLGAAAPSSNTATANRVALSSIPIGSATVTGRKVYRDNNGDSVFKLVTTIADNTTTTYTDSTANGSLGAVAPASDTSGLVQPDGQLAAGSTSVIVANSAGFTSTGGWAVIGNGRQVIRYTGLTANLLTGVPASGPGAIVASIAYNSTITQAPALIGIPTSGAGAILYDLAAGDEVNLLVTVEDTTARDVLAALVDGDGIIEEYIQDRRLSSTEAAARAQATLDLLKDPLVTVQYETFDRLTRSGREVTFNSTLLGLVGTFKIQSVTITDFDGNQRRFPRRQVVASSRRFTYEALLRQVRV